MIVIPDIHGRDCWIEPVRQYLGKEHIIFLGDCLDCRRAFRINDKGSIREV